MRIGIDYGRPCAALAGMPPSGGRGQFGPKTRFELFLRPFYTTYVANRLHRRLGIALGKPREKRGLTLLWYIVYIHQTRARIGHNWAILWHGQFGVREFIPAFHLPRSGLSFFFARLALRRLAACPPRLRASTRSGAVDQPAPLPRDALCLARARNRIVNERPSAFSRY